MSYAVCQRLSVENSFRSCCHWIIDPHILVTLDHFRGNKLYRYTYRYLRKPSFLHSLALSLSFSLSSLHKFMNFNIFLYNAFDVCPKAIYFVAFHDILDAREIRRRKDIRRLS